MSARLALCVALAAVMFLPAATYAGDYSPPPGDSIPVWSPDGSRIAFLTGRGAPGVAAVSADGSSERRLVDTLPLTPPYPSPSTVALSPDWQWAALTRRSAGAFVLTAVRIDGSEERQLGPVDFGTPPVWSPDSRRVAFRTPDGTLHAIGRDGSGLVRIASGGTDLAWSPDGTRIAYVGVVPTALDVHIVGADGEGDVLLAGGPGAQLQPRWSPDGGSVAFLTQPATGTAFDFGVAAADGSGIRTYPGPKVSNGNAYAWAPDSRSIVFALSATQGIFRLNLATAAARRLTSFGGTPTVSPDGTRIAFSGAGACGDRAGIYVATVAGAQVKRLTNDCRIIGTSRADVLHGTELGDILDGLAGDDRLYASDSAYVGDTLLGGDGADVLVGDIQTDVLQGGRGSDRLFGANGADELEGGAGRDRIDGQRGNDRVRARDGWRDTVSCGTNLAGRERDEAWVDRYDEVARDCEVVHRTR